MIILLFGDICLDVTIQVQRYPDAGKDAIVQQVHTRLGGSIVNTAVALAGLGLPVRLVGKAGQDPAGDHALGELAATGIDTTFIQRDSVVPTGQIFIVVSADGERTMFSARGANTLITPGSIPVNVFDGVARLHLSSYSFLAAPQKDTALQLFELAYEQGIPCSLDIADGHAALLKPELRALLAKIDTLFLNPSDAASLLGPSAPAKMESVINELMKLGPEQVTLKLSSQGCLVGTGGPPLVFPALPAAVIDTTGAGDAFAAGFIYARHTGLSVGDAAWLASAMGALATTVSGAGTALPRRRSLAAYIASLPAAVNQDGWQDRVLVHLGYNPYVSEGGDPRHS